MRTQNFDRSFGSRTTRPRTSGSGEIGVGRTCVIDQGCGGFQIDASSASACGAVSSAVTRVTVAVANDAIGVFGGQSTVCGYGYACIDDDVRSLQVDRSTRTRSSASAGLVPTGATATATGPDIRSDRKSSRGYDLDGSSSATALAFVAAPAPGTGKQVRDVGIPIGSTGGIDGLVLTRSTHRLRTTPNSGIGSTPGLHSRNQRGRGKLIPALELSASGLEGVG